MGEQPRKGMRSTGAIIMAVLLVSAIVAFVASAYGIGATRTVTSTTTVVSTVPDVYDQVDNSFANHVLFLSSANASAIASQFESNATVTWTGDIAPFQGNYVGAGNIFILMNSSIAGRGSIFSVGNVTHSVVGISGDSALVNSSFAFSGKAVSLGATYNGTVSAQDFFVYSAANGTWLISGETWDFITFNSAGLVPITG